MNLIGNIDDIAFYVSAGQNVVRRIRQKMNVSTGTIGSVMEEVDAADELQFRALYDRLLRISDAKPK